jgi:hypothetical protein
MKKSKTLLNQMAMVFFAGVFTLTSCKDKDDDPVPNNNNNNTTPADSMVVTDFEGGTGEFPGTYFYGTGGMSTAAIVTAGGLNLAAAPNGGTSYLHSAGTTGSGAGEGWYFGEYVWEKDGDGNSMADTLNFAGTSRLLFYYNVGSATNTALTLVIRDTTQENPTQPGKYLTYSKTFTTTSANTWVPVDVKFNQFTYDVNSPDNTGFTGTPTFNFPMMKSVAWVVSDQTGASSTAVELNLDNIAIIK